MAQLWQGRASKAVDSRVNDFNSSIRFDARMIEQDIRGILDQAGEYMDENRKTAIISAFSSRLGQLMVLAQVQRQEDDVAQDVDLDRAQDYGFKMEL